MLRSNPRTTLFSGSNSCISFPKVEAGTRGWTVVGFLHHFVEKPVLIHLRSNVDGGFGSIVNVVKLCQLGS